MTAASTRLRTCIRSPKRNRVRSVRCAQKPEDGKPAERRFRREECRQPHQGHREESKRSWPCRACCSLSASAGGRNQRGARAGRTVWRPRARSCRPTPRRSRRQPDVGPVVSQEIARFFAKPRTRGRQVTRLIDAKGDRGPGSTSRWPRSCRSAGLTFAITGTLAAMER